MSIVCAQPGDEIKLEIGLHQKRSCKMLLAVVVLRLESCMGREVKHQSYSFIYHCVSIQGPHGCAKSTVIERRQHQLGRMADFPPPVTFSVFDL